MRFRFGDEIVNLGLLELQKKKKWPRLDGVFFPSNAFTVIFAFYLDAFGFRILTFVFVFSLVHFCFLLFYFTCARVRLINNMNTEEPEIGSFI